MKDYEKMWFILKAVLGEGTDTQTKQQKEITDLMTEVERQSITTSEKVAQLTAIVEEVKKLKEKVSIQKAFKTAEPIYYWYENDILPFLQLIDEYDRNNRCG